MGRPPRRRRFIRLVKRLRRLVSRYDPEKRWFLGEFRHDRAYACGGAGAVLSRSALLSLDLDNCIARSSKRCQQSDWQLGDCVRRLVGGKGGGGGGGGDDGRITLETRHGCNTCAVPARNCSSEACDEPPPAGCHFMQDARPHVGWLRDTANCSRVRGPSIVHGTGVAQALQRGGAAGREEVVSAGLVLMMMMMIDDDLMMMMMIDDDLILKNLEG